MFHKRLPILLLLFFLPQCLFCAPKVAIKFYVSDDYNYFKKVIYEYFSKNSKSCPAYFEIVFDKSLHNKDKIEKDFAFIKPFNFKLNTYENYLEGLGDLSVIDKDFDILVLAQTDTYPFKSSYIEIISQDMEKSFKDLDGVIEYFNYGSIFAIGKNYLKNTKNIFPKGLKKFFFKQNLRASSDAINKYVLVNSSPFEGLNKRLISYTSNQDLISMFSSTELETKIHDLNVVISKFCEDYSSSKQAYFSSETFFKSYTPVWSVIIPNIKHAKKSFSSLYKNLIFQILQEELLEQIEVFCSQESSIQELLKHSRGQYISVIEPTDSISQDYIKTVYPALLESPDAIEFLMLKNGSKKFHYLGDSIQDKTQFIVEPNSLKNPVKIQFIDRKTLKKLPKKINKTKVIPKILYFSGISSREDIFSIEPIQEKKKLTKP